MKKSKLTAFALALVIAFSFAALTGCGASKIGVTFNLNYKGAPAAPNAVRVELDKEYGALPAPSRTNYTFAGWYTTPTSTAGALITADSKVTYKYGHILYARWTGESFNVTFDFGELGWKSLPIGVNEGQNGVITKAVRMGGIYGSLPDELTIPEGRLFKGWYISQTGGKPVTRQTVVSTGADHILYARTRADSWDFSSDADLESFADGTYTNTSNMYKIDGGQMAVTFNQASTAYAAHQMQIFSVHSFAAGTVMKLDLNFGYAGSEALIVHPTGTLEAVGATPNTMHAEISTTDSWSGARYSFRDFPNVKPNEAWPSGGTTVIYTFPSDGRLCITLRANRTYDIGKLTFYVGGIRVVRLDQSKTSWDFSNKTDLDYFTSLSSSSIIMTSLNIANRGGGAGDNWMSATVSPESPAAPVTAVVELGCILTAGAVAELDLDVVYAGANPLITATGNAEEANSIQFALYGTTGAKEVWDGTVRYSSSGHFPGVTPGAAWPAGGTRAAYTVPAGVVKLRILVRANNSVDFSKLTFYIGNVTITK